MTVTTIASIAANLSHVTTAQDTKPAAVLSSLVSTNAPTKDTTADIVATDNTADVSLQSQISQFRVVSQSIAAGNSVLATASAGGQDISRELGALHDLAQKASDVPLSPSERTQIDAEFQAIRSRINNIAATTKYGNDNLLDGSTSAAVTTPTAANSATIGSLTDAALFQGTDPNLLTVASSQEALQQVSKAQDYTNQQIATINSLQSGLDYASSTVQTALQNNDAAQSTLQDSDFETAPSASVALQPDINAQVAQTTRLPNSLLALLSE